MKIIRKRDIIRLYYNLGGENMSTSSYKKENYDRISLNLPKGSKKMLDEEANIRGFSSVGNLVANALLKAYDIDVRKKTVK